MRFRECERIATVVGSVAFSNGGKIICNPGIAASFPWLSGHAALFENYKVHNLTYRYKNLKGSTAPGNILLSFDYDTLDTSPSTAIEATQSTYYIDGAPWRVFQLKVPTDGRRLFTRRAAVVGADLKTYDMGALHISTEGCADTTPHGYLEVEYDIEFFNKQPSDNLARVGTATVTLATATAAVGIGADVPLVNAVIDKIGLTFTATEINLPIGVYIVTVDAGITTAPAGWYAALQLNGGTVVPFSLTNVPLAVCEHNGTIAIEVTTVSTLKLLNMGSAVTYDQNTTRITLNRL